MPINTAQISYFIKNEAGFPLNGGNISDYLGLGVKLSDNSFGSVSTMLAGKISENSKGTFLEARYTTPTFGETNLVLESRTRYVVDKPKGARLNQDITERLAIKYSKKVGNFNFYELLGVNAKYSVDNKAFKSVSGVSLTGVGTKLSKNINAYTELELSKSCNLQNKDWQGLSSAVYVGLNYNF